MRVDDRMGSEGGAIEVVAANEGVRAVELIEAVVARRPEKDDAALAAAVEAICAYRQGLIGRRDAAAWTDSDERGLATLNGVLSLVLAVQFPLGNVRWHELEGARAALAELVRRADAG